MSVHEISPRVSVAESPVPLVLLKPEQAARALGIGRTAVFQLIHSGRLRSVKLGGLRRVPMTALHEFVRQLEEEQAAA
jgi:excisionase family DNA binding protein